MPNNDDDPGHHCVAADLGSVFCVVSNFKNQSLFFFIFSYLIRKF